MAMYDKIPNDPIMLLSFINTQLRDTYESLEAFAAAYQLDAAAVAEKLRAVNYEYDAAVNQFI